jgi:LysM repeat protein
MVGKFPAPYYIGVMKKILSLTTILSVLACLPLPAQDAALEERVNKLHGYVQDLLAAQEAQRKQIEALTASIESLRERVGQAGANNPTQDDLRKIAEKVQEVDRKREADRELILKEIEALGKSMAGARRQQPSNPTPPARGNDKGYEHVVQSGETISAIAVAFREQGIKVTSDQIIAANPGLKPESLKPGQKIFIPRP